VRTSAFRLVRLAEHGHSRQEQHHGTAKGSEGDRCTGRPAPNRVELAELDGAGHALLPEKSDEIARLVIASLRRVKPARAG
jgi:hypothetical protein